jgi:hypothetical protein
MDKTHETHLRGVALDNYHLFIIITPLLFYPLGSQIKRTHSLITLVINLHPYS